MAPPAALLHLPLHPRLPAEERGEGEVRHRGLHRRRRRVLPLLLRARHLPDGRGDQEEGRQQVSTWDVILRGRGSTRQDLALLN